VHNDPIIFYLFVIFAGAAVAATAALFARQSLLVAYILLGGLLGPYGLGWFPDPTLVQRVSQVGVIFLLFLLGLNLHPQKLLRLLRETTLVTLASSVLFAVTGVAVGFAFGFTWPESLLIGAAMTFSSTIIGLKLLPTTQLHHQHTGEVIISILLLQDLIAIVLLLVLQGGHGRGLWSGLGMTLLALPALMVFALVMARLVVVRLFSRFDTIQEYVFLVTLGWCLGIAALGARFGLSYEIGAFIAGVAIASSPISTFIAESLKPLRDFFLVMFFFALGAGFDPRMALQVLLPAALLAGVLMALKPPVFRWLLERTGEGPALSREVGWRLGQVSEFSLFIAMLAQSMQIISARAAYLIELATLLTFFVSSYMVMLRYPTPIGVSARLRRD